jgi:hypothetical protein
MILILFVWCKKCYIDAHGQIRHEPSHKQLGLRANRTSVLCRNRTGHHNAELRTYRCMIGIKIHEHQYNTSYIIQTKLESCCTHCLLTCCLLPVHSSKICICIEQCWKVELKTKRPLWHWFYISTNSEIE